MSRVLLSVHSDHATDYVKVALMGVWILAVGVLGYVLGARFFVGWTVLAVIGVDTAGRHDAALESAFTEHVREHPGSASMI
jgi:hypothetical protein